MQRSILFRFLSVRRRVQEINTRPVSWVGTLKKIFLPQITPQSIKLVPNMNENHRLVWIDMEMTGLDPVADRILEVACIITEGNLSTVAEMPPIVIHQSDEILKKMNSWCVKHHGESGLTEASRKSTISTLDAETKLVNFLVSHTPTGKCPLAGNSVYMDRLFLARYMPKVDKHIHYRIIDVSSIKELCRRWNPDIYKEVPKKKLEHRAMEDIRESITELKYYQKKVFNVEPCK